MAGQDIRLGAADILPAEAAAVLVGRVWSTAVGGPCPVLLREGVVFDLSGLAATMSGLLEREVLLADLTGALPVLGPLDGFLDQGANRGIWGSCLCLVICRRSRRQA